MASNQSCNHHQDSLDASQSPGSAQATLECPSVNTADSIAEQIDLIQTQLADIAASAAESSQAQAEPNRQIGELREELLEQGVRLETLSQQLRADFQNALEDLRQTQTEAMQSQSEVLRSLAGSLISANGGPQAALPEQQLRELEIRLTESIHAALGSAATASPQAVAQTANNDAASTHNEPAATLEDSSQSWEQIRATFMQSNGSPSPVPQPNGPDDELVAAFMESEGRAAIAQSHKASVEDDSESHLKDTQQFVIPAFALDCDIAELGDVESMSEGELRAALLDRDHLVSTLIGRVRHLQDAHVNPISADELKSLEEELPQALQARVTETLDRMNEQLRLGELEMSLERARLARQKVQLEQSRHSLDRQARQMGLEQRDDGTYVVDRTEPARKQPRRWLGRLGIGE